MIAFQERRLHAFGHEQAGLPLADAMLSRIRQEKKLRYYVRNMVALHMQPNMLASQGSGAKAYNRLFDRSVCPEDLLLLSKADILGSCVPPAEYTEMEQLLRRRLSNYRRLMARPGVTGADLIQAGFKPGRAFHDALDYAHRMQLAGVEKKAALAQTVAFLRQQQEDS